MYYRVETKEVLVTHSDIRMSFAKGDVVVLFADVITNSDLEARGVFLLTSNKPDVTAMQVAVPGDVVEIDGVWTQEWSVRDKTEEELEADKPPVPQMVTRRQARQALLIKGVLDKVEVGIASLDDGTPEGKQKMQLAEIEWQDSLNFERNRPLVIELGKAIGFDAAGLDALFIFAATL